MGEVELAALFCAFLAGSAAEDRRYFDVNGLPRYVRVDCETDTHVIELGLDGTPSSRDSVHQALFHGHLTGKEPVVILIDQDGYEGRFEYEMRHVAKAAGVAYVRCGKDVILRWSTSAPMRHASRDAALDDIPLQGQAATACDLRALIGVTQDAS